eukprot:GHVS01025839.1.p2 GENE.GHVS01025839.1~~GHVS01025839.1.p2  ORF type:complete len:108 (-),score=3.90 GHVS01025839.1:332-655(-)
MHTHAYTQSCTNNTDSQGTHICTNTTDIYTNNTYRSQPSLPITHTCISDTYTPHKYKSHTYTKHTHADNTHAYEDQQNASSHKHTQTTYTYADHTNTYISHIQITHI